MSSARKLQRKAGRLELAPGAHLVSNQRFGDPPVIACACLYATTGWACMTVVSPGEPLECWSCKRPLCDGCKAKLAQRSN